MTPRAAPPRAPLLAEIGGQGFGGGALNYRGAGGAPGKPSQTALTADALALYDQLDAIVGAPVPATRRVLYGTSLGAALAVQLAAERPSAGLVLESPFNRLCEVAQFHYPIFPACLLLPYERWASGDLIGRLAVPVLILHGVADETIPLSQGRALFTAARGSGPASIGTLVWPAGPMRWTSRAQRRRRFFGFDGSQAPQFGPARPIRGTPPDEPAPRTVMRSVSGIRPQPRGQRRPW